MNTLTIKDKKLDQEFVDLWIDNIEHTSFIFKNIKRITLEEVEISTVVSYDIFHDFVNVEELDILHSHITSRSLTNVLTYINPHSLSKLNLSQSTFDEFNKDDLRYIGGLFGLMELVLPPDMDVENQNALKKILQGQ